MVEEVPYWFDIEDILKKAGIKESVIRNIRDQYIDNLIDKVLEGLEIEKKKDVKKEIRKVVYNLFDKNYKELQNLFALGLDEEKVAVIISKILKKKYDIEDSQAILNTILNVIYKDRKLTIAPVLEDENSIVWVILGNDIVALVRSKKEGNKIIAEKCVLFYDIQ